MIEPAAAVIDLDEFEAARRDPRVREILERALAYGERVNAQRRKTRERLIYGDPSMSGRLVEASFWTMNGGNLIWMNG